MARNVGATALGWVKQSQGEIDALFATQRATDRFGSRLHLLCAAVACFMAGWPTTFVTWGAVPLLVCWGVRMWTHHRVIGPLWWSWVARFSAAWAVWVLVGLIWTPDRKTGWDEAGVLPFLLMIPALYPVLDRRGVLLGALMAGIACGMVTQMMHGLGVRLDVAAMRWNRLPGRNSGWWDPVIGGSVLCAMMGMCAGLVLGARRRVRALGVIGTIAAVAAIIATGTRGAWIGGVLTVCVAVALAVAMWAFVRTSSAEGGRKGLPKRAAMLVCAVVLLVVVGAGAVMLSRGAGGARARLDAGIREVKQALHEGDYTSDTARRVAMWQWAYAAWRCHPVMGVGTGGYRAWVGEQAARVREGKAGTGCTAHGPLERAGAEVHAHAHGVWPQTAATGGTVGVLLLWGLVGAAVVSGLRACFARRAEQSSCDVVDRAIGVSAMLGFVALMCAGLFDTVTVNQQTWYVASLLLALSVELRPSVWQVERVEVEIAGCGVQGVAGDGVQAGAGGEG